PRKISSHDRQRIPHRYALSFEIVFDGHCDHSPTDAGDSQIPIARAADRRPSDSRFPSLKVFERRPRLGPTASLCKGPASENLHRLRKPRNEHMSSARAPITDIGGWDSI